MKETRKPLPSTRLGLLLERIGPWRNTLIVALTGLILVAVSRFDNLRDGEALVIALGTPVVLLALAFAPLRDGPPTLRVAGLVVLLMAGALFARQIWTVFVPPDPLGRVELAEDDEPAEIPVADDVEAVEIEVRGDLVSHSGEAAGRYRIEVDRGEVVQWASGRMERRVVASRVGRRGAGLAHEETREVTREPMHLEARGPVRLRLASVDGLQTPLEVSILPAPLVGSSLWLVLGALGLIALVLEGWAGRHRIDARWTAAVAASGVLVHHLVYRFDADDPMHTVFGGLLFAGLTGGFGGWIVGVLVAHLARGRRSAARGAVGAS